MALVSKASTRLSDLKFGVWHRDTDSIVAAFAYADWAGEFSTQKYPHRSEVIELDAADAKTAQITVGIDDVLSGLVQAMHGIAEGMGEVEKKYRSMIAERDAPALRAAQAEAQRDDIRAKYDRLCGIAQAGSEQG